jgi:lysophospholipid acyltransferase (LPLAT)-like uncharacterized protein
VNSATPGSSPDSPRPAGRGARVIPHPPSRGQRIAATLIYGFIRALAATVRFRIQDPGGYFRGGVPGPPCIFAVWHNRLALCLTLYERYVVRYQPGRRMAAMVSASRDGGLLTWVLERFHVVPIRGSSSRRGPQALRELVSCARRGLDLAITPDGPRGPRYVVQDGVVALAQLSGCPILAASYQLQWKITVRSWDGFQIPLPFTRCDVYVGDLVRVPREAEEADRRAVRESLEQMLRQLNHD